MTVETAEAVRQASLYELLAEDLAALDVEKVFGLFGEDTAGLAAMLAGSGIAYYAGRHENECVMMANGYGTATGKLGVCITSRGPGLTHGLTGALTASRRGAPVLIITGAPALKARDGYVDYKCLDGTQLLSDCGLTAYHPRTAAEARRDLRDGVAVAMSGRTVALNIPVDVLNAPTTSTDGEPFPPRAVTTPVEPDSESVALAAAVLNRSRRPLVVAGRGADRSGARELLVELADRTGALLGTTLYAKGFFAGHPFNIGIVGGFASTAAKEVAQGIDCVLAVGASLNHFTTEFGSWFGGATLIQVDARREHIGRYFRADVGVAGDARLVTERLVESVDSRARSDQPLRTDPVASRLAGYDVSEDFVAVPDRAALDPQVLIRELDELLPADRMVIPDGGAHFNFVSSYMSVQSPDRFHAPIDFHAIGLGLGTAVGAGLARPTTTTVLFVGDGALLMSLGDLETVARTRLPLLVVVVNDGSYGAEQHFVELMGLPHQVTLIPDIDFAAAARGLGLEAITIRSLDELQAIAARLGGLTEPLLLDCKVSNVRPRQFDEMMAPKSD